MTSDLRVKYQVLDDSERSLHRIVKEFESCTERLDTLERVWGSRDVADAMRDFADNWDRHRKKLLESLKSVGEMCASVKQTFQGADRELSNKLRDASG